MISLVAAGNIVNLIYSSNSHMDSLSKQNIVKGNFIGELVTESNWKATYADQTNMNINKMDCLYNHTDCSALIGAPQVFRIIDSKLNVAYDGSATGGPTNGFTATGGNCSTYGKASDACPYHYDLTWEPICQAGSCIDPLVKIHAKFSVNFASQVAGRPNSTNYLPMNFDLIMNMKPRANLYAYPITFYVNWNAAPGPYTPFSFSIPHSPIANAEGAVVLTKVTKGDPAAVVTMSGNTISYTPKLNFYGMDFMEYEFRDEIGNTGKGRVWMKVVTPFTWVGDGTDKRASSKANWCGNVSSDGQCMHDLDPSSPVSTSAGWIYPHLVFNSNCNVCSNIELDLPQIDALEISSSFHGKVTQTANVMIESKSAGWMNPNPYNTNYAHQGFYQAAGTFDTNGNNLSLQTDFTRTPMTTTTFEVGSGGTFTTTNTLSLFGTGLTLDPGANFSNLGTITIGQYWSHPGYIYAPNYDLGNVNFDNGWATGYNIGSPIKIRNFLINGKNDGATSICGAAGNDITITGSLTAINGGANANCGAGQFAEKLILSSVGPAHQQIIGSMSSDASAADHFYPVSIPNLVTPTTNTVDIIGHVGVYGTTLIAGPINAGTSTFYLNGPWDSTLNVAPGAPTPHFYNLDYFSGGPYEINQKVIVDNDLIFDHQSSIYGLFSHDKANAQIILKGDLHLRNGQMDANPSNSIVVNFQGTNDQKVISEGYYPFGSASFNHSLSAPSIWVNKPSGNFSIVESAGAPCLAAGQALCTIQFAGDFVYTSAASLSITGSAGAHYYFGYGNWHGGVPADLKSTTGALDFGIADLDFLANCPWYFGTFNFGNAVLSAHSIKGGGTFTNVTLNLSGDFNMPTYASYPDTNVTLNFSSPGGILGATHNFSTLTPLSYMVNIADNNTVNLTSDLTKPTYSPAITLSLAGSAVFNQSSNSVNATMIGPASTTWNRGTSSFTGNSTLFLGTIH